MFRVRPARPSDRSALVAMREALWPDGSAEEHGRELDALVAGSGRGGFPYLVLVALSPDGLAAGFAEVSVRSYADGCDPSTPVGYLEGWFVAAECRGRGVGRLLVDAAQQWAREQGCREMASDTWISNLASQHAHRALGFEEVDRCVNYRKKL